MLTISRSPSPLLLVARSAALRRRIDQLLIGAGLPQCDHVASLEEALLRLACGGQPIVVLLDASFDEQTVCSGLRRLRVTSPRSTPIVLARDHAGTVDALLRGAYDGADDLALTPFELRNELAWARASTPLLQSIRNALDRSMRATTPSLSPLELLPRFSRNADSDAEAVRVIGLFVARGALRDIAHLLATHARHAPPMIVWAELPPVSARALATGAVPSDRRPIRSVDGGVLLDRGEQIVCTSAESQPLVLSASGARLAASWRDEERSAGDFRGLPGLFITTKALVRQVRIFTLGVPLDRDALRIQRMAAAGADVVAVVSDTSEARLSAAPFAGRYVLREEFSSALLS